MYCYCECSVALPRGAMGWSAVSLTFCRCRIYHIMLRILGDDSYDLNPNPKVKAKGQIIYVLVNAYHSKTFRRSNFKLCRCIGPML